MGWRVEIGHSDELVTDGVGNCLSNDADSLNDEDTGIGTDLLNDENAGTDSQNVNDDDEDKGGDVDVGMSTDDPLNDEKAGTDSQNENEDMGLKDDDSKDDDPKNDSNDPLVAGVSDGFLSD